MTLISTSDFCFKAKIKNLQFKANNTIIITTLITLIGKWIVAKPFLRPWTQEPVTHPPPSCLQMFREKLKKDKRWTLCKTYFLALQKWNHANCKGQQVNAPKQYQLYSGWNLKDWAFEWSWRVLEKKNWRQQLLLMLSDLCRKAPMHNLSSGIKSRQSWDTWGHLGAL